MIDPANPKSEWTKVFSKVIKDKKGREEMGRNLKTITDEYFDINKVVKFRLDLYEEALRVSHDISVLSEKGKQEESV